MELENDLRKLRWNAPPGDLRARILRDAHAGGSRTRIILPWLATIERHWLYPGRVPATALLVAWLVIVSFRFTTPESLLPVSGPMRRLTDEDLARIESQRAQLFAELRRAEQDEHSASPTQLGLLSPRS